MVLQVTLSTLLQPTTSGGKQGSSSSRELVMLTVKTKQIKRTRQGCFTCRSRKKKCDEVRPKCTGCQRNGLDCEWPTHRNQTLRAYRQKVSKEAAALQAAKQEELASVDLEGLDRRLEVSEREYLHTYLGPVMEWIVPPPSVELLRSKATKLVLDDLVLPIALCMGEAFCNNMQLTPSLADRHAVALKAVVQRASMPGFESMSETFLHALMLFMLFESITGISSNFIRHIKPAFQIMLRMVNVEGHSLKDDQHFKLLVDSFSYHYAVNMLSFEVQHFDDLPNPFHVQTEMAVLYLDKGHDQWLKHPIFGCCSSAFSVCLKASYLFRFPSRTNVVRRGASLLAYVEEEVQMYKSSDDEYQVLRHLILLSSGILLMKVLNPFVNQNNPEVQEYVTEFFSAFRNYLESNTMGWIGNWAIMIASFCVTDQESRLFVEEWYTSRTNQLSRDKVWEIVQFAWTKDDTLELLYDPTLVQGFTLT